MTIFITHDCRFRRLMASKVYKETQLILKAITVESQLEIKYN